MRILVMDGQGGKIGSQLIRGILTRDPDAEIMAVGTNATATAAMVRAGAQQAATGENPTVVACRTADVIIGPIGIVIAGSLLGEITAGMAAAVGESPAKKILIPVNNKNHCHHLIVGCQPLALGEYIKLVCDEVEKLLKQ